MVSADDNELVYEHLGPQYLVNLQEGRAVHNNPPAPHPAAHRPGPPAWVDAQALARDSPAAFEVPPDGALARIARGQPVQVQEGRDRFWVIVTGAAPAPAGGHAVHDRELVGVVDNFLVAPHPFEFGDTVAFRARHVQCAPATAGGD